MRPFSLLLTAVLLVSACEDALGPAGGCASEMRDFRRTYGSPNEVQSEESAGDYFETWTYEPSGTQPGLFVLFRWGVSIDGCVVEGPVSIDLVPLARADSTNPTAVAANPDRPTADRITA